MMENVHSCRSSSFPGDIGQLEFEIGKQKIEKLHAVSPFGWANKKTKVELSKR
jgi:hypothetical protein